VRIDAKEVLRIARLAHLDLAEEEIARLSAELSSILSHVEMLRSVDTQGVAETFHPLEYGGPMRADDTVASLGAAEATRGAPGGAAGAFLVPRIIG
jgi:aspartyl-tRNA(Asn)/glutamyl-tRNA(Gln) amidotransferase subunit C